MKPFKCVNCGQEETIPNNYSSCQICLFQKNQRERSSMDNINQVLEERGNNYGSYRDNANISQDLKKCLSHGSNYMGLAYFHKEALDNICQKMARIVNGNPQYEDNWIDIIGYAQLALNEIKKDNPAVLNTSVGSYLVNKVPSLTD